jgi:hypothetical protein
MKPKKINENKKQKTKNKKQKTKNKKQKTKNKNKGGGECAGVRIKFRSVPSSTKLLQLRGAHHSNSFQMVCYFKFASDLINNSQKRKIKKTRE